MKTWLWSSKSCIEAKLSAKTPARNTIIFYRSEHSLCKENEYTLFNEYTFIILSECQARRSGKGNWVIIGSTNVTFVVALPAK